MTETGISCFYAFESCLTIMGENILVTPFSSLLHEETHRRPVSWCFDSRLKTLRNRGADFWQRNDVFVLSENSQNKFKLHPKQKSKQNLTKTVF